MESYDPIMSFLLLPRASGADGITPAQFLASGQRASGEPAIPKRNQGRLHKPSFFSIINNE